jgi:hypothetical protein
LRKRIQDRADTAAAETTTRNAAKDTLDVTGAELKDLIASAGGGNATPEAATRYGHLMKIRQGAVDYFTKAKFNQTDPASLDPDTLYAATALATGRTPEDIQAAPGHIQNIQMGVESGNPSLTLQGANGLLAPNHRARAGPQPSGVHDPAPARLRQPSRRHRPGE